LVQAIRLRLDENACQAIISRLDWQDDAYFALLFCELPWAHRIECIRIDDPLTRASCEPASFQEIREAEHQFGPLQIDVSR
jgi:hypothetical protein